MENISLDFVNTYNETEPTENDTMQLLRSNLLTVNRIGDLIGFITNCALMFITINKHNTRARQSYRVVQYLIANMCFLSNLATLINLFGTGKTPQLVTVPAAFCSLVSFLRGVVYTAFSVNIVMVVYERLQSFQNPDNTNRVRTAIMIILIWTTSALFNVPTALMKTGVTDNFQETTENNTYTGKMSHASQCKSIRLFGMLGATIFYETIRFFFLHVGVGIYMLYALLEIRSRLQYLILNANLSKQRLDQKMNSIRLVYFYLLTFFITQLPIGVIVFYKKITPRMSTGSLMFTEFVKSLDTILSPALVLHWHMSPLISYMVLEGFKFQYLICYFQQPFRATVPTGEQREVSLLATYYPTSLGGQEVATMPTHNTQNESESGNISQMRRDSKILQTVNLETPV